MNFWQRSKDNNDWIRKYGCAFLSSLYRLYDLFNPKIKLNANEWLKVYQDKGLLDVSGYLLWHNLWKLFPVKISSKIWEGEHPDPKFIKKGSIISVDGQKKVGYQSHFLKVTEKLDNIVFAYDPYFDDTTDIEVRYGKGTLQETIYSIINIDKDENV